MSETEKPAKGALMNFVELALSQRESIRTERGQRKIPLESAVLTEKALELIETARSQRIAPPAAAEEDSRWERHTEGSARLIVALREEIVASGFVSRLETAREALAERLADLLCKESEDGTAASLAGGSALLWADESGELRARATRGIEEEAGVAGAGDEREPILGAYLLDTRATLPDSAEGQENRMFREHFATGSRLLLDSPKVKEAIKRLHREAIGLPAISKAAPKGEMGSNEAFARIFFGRSRIPEEFGGSRYRYLKSSATSGLEADLAKEAGSAWNDIVEYGRMMGRMRSQALDLALGKASERLSRVVAKSDAIETLMALRLADPTPGGRSLSEIAEASRRRELAERSKRIASEAPGIGAFCLLASRLLGLEVGDSLTGQVKAELKREGLVTEGGWKKLAEALREGSSEKAEDLIGPATRRALQKKDAAPMARREEAGREALLSELKGPLAAFSLAATAGVEAKVALGLIDALGKAGRADEAAFRSLMGVGLPQRQVATPEQAKAFVMEWEAKEARKGTVCAGLIRRAAAAGAPTALSEWGLCWDWLTRAEEGSWSGLPEKPDWALLMSRQRQWHEMMLARQRGDKEKLAWAPAAGKIDGGALVAEELCDGYRLWEEGKAMSHCVSSYAAECARGDSRIFSIRNEEGERLATLQIAPERHASGSVEGAERPADIWPMGTGDRENRFRVIQLRGKCNASIQDPAVKDFAEEIAKKAGEALAVDWKKKLEEIAKGEPKEASAPKGPGQ